MKYSLQRASMWKRLSAWLLDAILLCITATLAAFLLSTCLGYDRHSETLNERFAHYEAEYGVPRDLTEAQIAEMFPEALARVEEASQALAQDKEATYAYTMMMQLIILITSLSLLAAYLLLEFLLPQLLHNGQTVGKKVFGLGVMRENGVRLNGVSLFTRTVLGKYTIETMIPVMMLLMLFFGSIGVVGLLILGGIVVIQVLLLVTTRERTPIHDKLAGTVTIDLASQMIFQSEADRIAYQEKAAAEKAAAQTY